VTNYTAQAMGQTRIIASGYRYVTEELTQDKVKAIQNGTLQCSFVVASGFSGKP
jgi:hypothetical protein